MSFSSIRSMVRFDSPLAFALCSGTVRAGLTLALASPHRLGHQRATFRSRACCGFFRRFPDNHIHTIGYVFAFDLGKCTIGQPDVYMNGSHKLVLFNPDSPACLVCTNSSRTVFISFGTLFSMLFFSEIRRDLLWSR